MEYLALILILGFILRLIYKKQTGIKLIIPTIIVIGSSFYLFEDFRIAISLIVIMLIVTFIARKVLASDRAISIC